VDASNDVEHQFLAQQDDLDNLFALVRPSSDLTWETASLM
jgi:hypothetical protein